MRSRGADRWAVPVIALGGMLGASARFTLERAWPPEAGTVPWTTLVVNLSGCALIGMLMVSVTEVGGAHVLLRPFLGVGVLGGYTTFSTYAVEGHDLVLEGEPGLATAYLVGTAVTALLAVGAGVVAARAVLVVRRRLLAGPPRVDR